MAVIIKNLIKELIKKTERKMKYYNENPQITALKEAHQKEVKLIKEAILILDNTYRKKLEEFNSLPWYKKMFYKFEL